MLPDSILARGVLAPNSRRVRRHRGGGRVGPLHDRGRRGPGPDRTGRHGEDPVELVQASYTRRQQAWSWQPKCALSVRFSKKLRLRRAR
jgi:hypothetical protein